MKYLINYKLFENNNILKNTIISLKPQLAQAAQHIYDLWNQNDEGFAEMYGYGGICDDIANAMCDVIYKNTQYDSFYLYNEYDYHTSIYVYDTESETCYNVDISPYFYEEGAAYTWKQIKNVEFIPSMISIRHVCYEDYIDQDGNIISSYE